jgi:cytochrome c oxidase subunit 1
MHWVGVEGMPRRIYTYPDGMGWNLWNKVETFGTFIIVLAFVVFVINMYLSLVLGEQAPADPWDGATLEWSMSSPPPVYNFATIPVVTNRLPLWTEKYPEVYGEDAHERGVLSPAEADAEGNTSVPEHRHDHAQDADLHNPVHEAAHDTIHMPNQSYWPPLSALGIALGFAGFLVEPYHWLTFVGIVLAAISIYGWALEPAFGDGDDDEASEALAPQPTGRHA